MDKEPTFSLSYEQITRIAEEEIRNCNIRRDSRDYLQQLARASATLSLWSTLAYTGFQNNGQSGYDHVNPDWVRLKALLVDNDKKED